MKKAADPKATPFGELASRSIDLRGLHPADLSSLVESMRDAEVFVALHATSGEHWVLKGDSILENIMRSRRAAKVQLLAVTVPNFEMTKLLAAAVLMMEEGDWPAERGMSLFFAEEFTRLSERGLLH